MDYAWLLFLSVAFFELLLILKVGASARTIIASSHESMRVLASRDLADDEKEAHVRRGSLLVLKATLALTGKLLVTGAVLVALFALFVVVFPDLRQPLLSKLYSPAVIAVLTVVVTGYAWVRMTVRRRSQTP